MMSATGRELVPSRSFPGVSCWHGDLEMPAFVVILPYGSNPE
jgi:hypothetical protein